jgi:hypothetical protein
MYMLAGQLRTFSIYLKFTLLRGNTATTHCYNSNLGCSYAEIRDFSRTNTNRTRLSSTTFKS